MAKEKDEEKGGGCLSLILILVILFGIGYYISPYWTVIKIEKAMREGNKEYLNEHIKFKKIRNSVKEEIKVFSKDLITSSDNVLVNIAGGILGGAIVDTAMTQIDPIIKEIVSADGLINMAKSNEYPEDNKQNKNAVFTKKGVNYINLLKTGKFTAYNKFEFSIMKYADEEEANGEGEICSFVCELQGFKWIYTDIKFKDNWEQYLREHLNLNMNNTNSNKSTNRSKDEDDE